LNSIPKELCLLVAIGISSLLTSTTSFSTPKIVFKIDDLSGGLILNSLLVLTQIALIPVDGY
jgi:hypothetical protein